MSQVLTPPPRPTDHRRSTTRLLAAVTTLAVLLALLSTALVVVPTAARAQDPDEPPVDTAFTEELAARHAAPAATGSSAASAAASTLPQVTVIATGGTLAGRGTAGPTGFQNYAAGSYPIERLVDESFELGAQWARDRGRDPVAEVDTIQFTNKGSGSVTFPELYELSALVDRTLETADAVVVTTGTDTMEEIGRFLDLTVRSPKPVVLTGAMRPWDVVGTDGPANLHNAIVVAASGKTSWFGAVLVLNDEIHAIADVTKGNTVRMDTFDTPQIGMLGYVDRDLARIFRTPPRALSVLEAVANHRLTYTEALAAWQTPFDLGELDGPEDLPRVEIFYGYHQGGGDTAIDAWAADGVRGIVTAGTGAGGGVPSGARNRAINQGVVFVTTSRTGSGSVYSGNSGAIIPGDAMRPPAARILLMLALAFNDDVQDVRADVLRYASMEGDVGQRLEALLQTAPLTRDDCMDDRWRLWVDPTFTSRGACITFVTRGG